MCFKIGPVGVVPMTGRADGLCMPPKAGAFFTTLDMSGHDGLTATVLQRCRKVLPPSQPQEEQAGEIVPALHTTPKF